MRLLQSLSASDRYVLSGQGPIDGSQPVIPWRERRGGAVVPIGCEW